MEKLEKINFSLKKTEGVSECKNKFKITVYIYYKNSVKRCFSLIYVDQGTWKKTFYCQWILAHDNKNFLFDQYLLSYKSAKTCTAWSIRIINPQLFICAIHVQYVLFLLIKYKIINPVNIWDNLPKLYFLSFIRDN